MGRWRPPAERSSPYITAEGAAKLTNELKQLWKVERPEVTEKVQAAAKNGDRSENGDYIYGKQRLREIDRRVRYLSKRLDEVTIVDRPPKEQGRVYFGAWIEIEFSTEDKETLRIVGADEIDSTKRWISLDSPLAKAAIGKSVGDKVRFESKTGLRQATICSISYRSQQT